MTGPLPLGEATQFFGENAMKPNKNFYLFTGLILLGLLTLAACNPAEPEPAVSAAEPVTPEAVIAEGHLVPNDHLYLACAARGKVTEILVKEGDLVRAGDVLVRLGDRQQAEAGLAAARLELVSAQQAYDEFVRLATLSHAQAWQDYLAAQVARAAAQTAWDELDLDEIDDRIDEAEADLNDARESLQDAQEEFDKYKDLSENNASRTTAKDELDAAEKDYNEALRLWEETRQEKDLPRAALDQASAAEAEARRSFENTLEGPDAEQFALVEARLNNAKAQVSAAEQSLANFDLTAPFDGEVVDLNVTLNETTGPETWAVLLADFSRWYVETSDLTELEVVDISEGQQASIVPDALPELTIPGVVETISRAFTAQGGDILYSVRLRVDELDARLRWGMTVEITFEPEP